MAKRCGFYVRNGVIVRRDVDIAWNLGFEISSKRRYIAKLHEALGDDVTPIAEVTTASGIEETRKLSPMILEAYGKRLTVEDYWQDVVKPGLDKNTFVNGLLDFIYLVSLKPDNIAVALKYNCYTDVFHNPDKVVSGNTQAKSLALLRLMYETDNLSYINVNGVNEFLSYYNTVRIEVENFV